MSNDYFNFTDSLTRQTLARASALNALFAAIANGFDLLPGQFDTVYLGAKASDPTTDNQGGALAAGMMYFNTTSNGIRVYTGSAWIDPGVYNPAAVAITGGTITGITDLAIADGGTGASTAAAARTALGLDMKATLLRKSANQSIPNAANTPLTWNTETYDDDDIHTTSGDTTIVTVPAGYNGERGNLVCQVMFNNNSTGTRAVQIVQSGTIDLAHDQKDAHPSAGTSLLAVWMGVPLTTGKTFGVQVSQTSGGALSVDKDQTYFYFERRR